MPGHRLGPGGEEHGHELGELGVGEPTGVAVVVDDLGIEEVGEHVVTRVLLPVLEHVRQVPVHLHECLHRHLVDHADRTFLEVEDVVDDVAQVVAVLLGHAEEHRDHRRREDRREVLYVVELRLAHVRVEELGADLADAVLERRHATRRERTRHELPEHRVLGRVEPDDHAGVDDRRLGHRLDRGAVVGAERLVVLVRGLDVVEARQHPEVVLLVVPDRRLVTHPLPQRVRVVAELRGERVPVEVTHLSSRHLGVTAL